MELIIKKNKVDTEDIIGIIANTTEKKRKELLWEYMDEIPQYLTESKLRAYFIDDICSMGNGIPESFAESLATCFCKIRREKGEFVAMNNDIYYVMTCIHKFLEHVLYEHDEVDENLCFPKVDKYLKIHVSYFVDIISLLDMKEEYWREQIYFLITR